MTSLEFDEECLALKLTFEEHQGELIYDDSGIGNNAKLLRGAEVSYDDMQGGFSVHLKSKSSILVNNRFNFKPKKSASVAMWVRMDDPSGHHNLFRTKDKDGVLHYNLAATDGKITWSHRDEHGNQLFAISTQDPLLAANEWHQVTGTVDADSKEALLWVDGKLVGNQSKVAGTLSQDWSGEARFGGDFVGAVDNIFIYRCAISSQTVSQLYSGGTSNEQSEFLKPTFL